MKKIKNREDRKKIIPLCNNISDVVLNLLNLLPLQKN